MDLNNLKNKKYFQELMNKYNVESLYVFGSAARGTNTIDSDLDLIVEFAGKRNLFKIIELSQKLSEISGVKVDLVTKDSISEYMKDNIEREKIVVYKKDESFDKTNTIKREKFKNTMEQ